MPFKIARVLLTMVLLGGAAASFALDWSPNHLLNPAWHPHARFHVAQFLFFHAGVALTGTWLLWRRSKEPLVAATSAALLAASFWTPLFFVTTVLPGSNVWPGGPETIPHIAGYTFYPNLAVAVAFLFVIAGSWYLSRLRHRAVA
jgi:Family of unknown function (DUF6640)